MNPSVIGITAGLLCTISFIPQVIKIYKTKNAKDLSLVTFSMFSAGVSLWTLYGIVLKDYPIIFANAVTLAFSLMILTMKIKYK